MEERLQKILSRAGLTSRRAAEKMILAGRVRVNGQVVDQLGRKADPIKDSIEVDGQTIEVTARKVYLLFNKPMGFITTLKDPQGRPTIAEFLSKLESRVYPVGRLDRDTEGLLILTNDGDLARRLMHPRFHVPKVYLVKVLGRPSDQTLARLSGGEILLGDRPAAPAKVEIFKDGQKAVWLKMTLIEGRHRQIKRMCSQVGHPVLSLKRIAYGPLSLGGLKPGTMRGLAVFEVRALKQAIGSGDP